MAMTAASLQNDRLVVDGRAAVAGEVRALMGRHRVNQKQLAQALGCSQAAVSRRLSGEIAFDTDDLVRIARLFDIEPSELVSHLRSRCFYLVPNDADAMQLSFAFDRQLAIA
jgi:transcriptional regulator with XRE-family HTH domain